MLEFRQVTREDLDAVCALTVKAEQDGLVTSNVMTMAEAQFEPGALVRAAWQDHQPVGLLAMLRPSAYPEDQDITIRRDMAYVWRFMVDAKFQGKGFGRQMMHAAGQTARDWGYDGLSLTVGSGPHSAIPFYQRCGFELTGRKLWGDAQELEMILWFDKE